MSDYDLTEMGRQLANLVRIGQISELDVTNARVKVSVAGLTTEWLPWAASRAGTTRQWSPPKVGEQVIIASPYGDMAQAVVIGSIYQDDHPAPASSGDQEHIAYPDGSTVDYNHASNTLTVTVSGNGNVVVNCKVATINANTSVTLNTPQTHCTGDLVVDGNGAFNGGTLTHKGKNVGSTHTHTGVTTGGGNTGAPA